MATHSLHDPVRESGLADGCPRCSEIAAMPFETLDDENLAQLLERTRWWVKSDAAGVPRSDNEAKAMRIVEVALLHRLQLDKLDAARAKAQAA